MNKSDLERLAQERLKDAEVLLNHGQWSGADEKGAFNINPLTPVSGLGSTPKSRHFALAPLG